MLKYGKILALFVSIASLSFMAFAIATTFGGPDWSAELKTEPFKGYRVTQNADTPPKWVAFREGEQQAFFSSRALPAVLAKVLDDVINKKKQELQSVQARENPLKERNSLLTASIAADEQALKNYETQHQQMLAELQRQHGEVASQVIAATKDAQKLENTISVRREDVLRLRQQVEETKVDEFRLQEIRKQIESLRIQTQGDLERAQRRADLLKQWVP